MKIRVVLQVIGLLQVFVGLTMLLPLMVGLAFGEPQWRSLAEAMAICLAAGLAMWLLNRNQGEIRVREGFGIVALGWLVTAGLGALPFMFAGSIPSFTDAYFETLSGYTTTGASILTEIESLPKSMLFWRSLTH